jgi:hypothetical protein
MDECLAFYSPSHSTFPFTHSCLLFVLRIKLGFPPFISSQDDPLHLWPIVTFCRDPFLCCSHGEEQIASHDVVWNAFASIVRDTWFHISYEVTHVLASFFHLIFLSMGWHHIIKWWHSHNGKCNDYWPHLSKLGFSNYFILQGARDDGSLGKGRTLPQLLYLPGCPWWW